MKGVKNFLFACPFFCHCTKNLQMLWNGFLVAILSIAFVTSYPTETTTSSGDNYGGASTIPEAELAASQDVGVRFIRGNAFVVRVKELWRNLFSRTTGSDRLI